MANHSELDSDDSLKCSPGQRTSSLISDESHGEKRDGKWQKLRPFAKVAFKGCIACTILSGIWSFLSNVSTLLVMPSREYTALNNHGDIYDGISCIILPTHFLHRTVSSQYQTDQHHCNAIAYQMVNSSVSGSEWDCHSVMGGEINLATDHRLNLFGWFVTAVVFTFLSSFFSVVHDCALIHFHRQQKMETLHFWPMGTMSWQEEFPITYALFGKCLSSDSSCVRFLTKLLAIYVFLIEFAICKLLYIPLCRCKPFGRGMVEMSSIWVGVARIVVVFSATVFCVLCASKLTLSIDPLDDSCNCFCNYGLRPFDAAKFLLASITLIILNWVFMKTWKDETNADRFYLYLVSYTVPIVILDALHHADLTGGVIRKPDNMLSAELMVDIKDTPDPDSTMEQSAGDDSKIQIVAVEADLNAGHESTVVAVHSVLSDEEKETVDEKRDRDDEPDDVDGRGSRVSNSRRFLYLISIMLSVGSICLLPSYFAYFQSKDLWGWPDWPRYVIYTVDALLFVCACYGLGLWIELKSVPEDDGNDENEIELQECSDKNNDDRDS